MKTTLAMSGSNPSKPPLIPYKRKRGVVATSTFWGDGGTLACPLLPETRPTPFRFARGGRVPFSRPKAKRG